MSLILGVTNGDTLFLNDVVLQIIETAQDKKHIHVTIGGKDFLLNDRNFVEIHPTVFACVGKAKFEKTREGEVTLPRLAIDAPRSITITRKRTGHYGTHHN